MVIIKFLDKIFKNKKEAQIPALELQEWFEEESESLLRKIDEKVESGFNDIQEIKNKLQQNLKELKDSSLMNPDIIQSRERHLIEGNREAYIRKMNHFLESIKIPELTYENSLAFSEELHDKLESFSQNSHRSFYILKNYFNDVLSSITQNLKSLDDAGILIKKTVTEDEVKRIIDIIDSIKEFNASLHKKGIIESKIDEMSSELADKEDKKEEAKQKIENLRSSEEFAEYNGTLEKKEKIEKKINKTKSDLLQVISPFDKYLRKYQRESLKEDLIRAYLNDPSNALIHDKNQEILGVLRDLKGWLKNEEIKSKEKILSKIDSVDSSLLVNFADDLISSYKERDIIEHALKTNTTNMNYKELDYQIEHFESKINELQQELKKSESELTSLKLIEKKKKLESEIFGFTEVELTII